MGLFDQFGRPIKGNNQGELPPSIDVPTQNTNKAQGNNPDENAESIDQKVSKILGFTSFTALLVALFFVASNGFFNFFSDIPGFQIYPATIAICLLVFWGSHRQFSKHKWSKWCYLLPLIICISIGALSVRAVRIKNSELVGPASITVEVGPAINPKDPFGTSIVIRNDGKPTISNIWTTFYWVSPKSKFQMYRHRCIDPIPCLVQKMRQGVHFSPEDNKVKPPFEPITFVQAAIRYTPENSTETNQVFQFCVQRDINDNYVWIPAGVGVDETMLSQADSFLSFFDVVPYLNIAIISIKDDFTNNQEYPIKMEYEWENIGGITATNVSIEWGAMTPELTPYFLWNRRTFIFPNPLWPGETNRVSRSFTEGPLQDIFSGIMSGRLILGGIATFFDGNGYRYVMKIKAIKTNDVFNVICIGVGGHFNDIQEMFRTNGLPATNSARVHK